MKTFRAEPRKFDASTDGYFDFINTCGLLGLKESYAICHFFL